MSAQPAQSLLAPADVLVVTAIREERDAPGFASSGGRPRGATAGRRRGSTGRRRRGGRGALLDALLTRLFE